MRLGVIPTIAPFILPALLRELRETYPEFRLFIREDLSEHLVEALNRGELDVLLLALPFPAQGVEQRPLFADEFLLACPASHPLAEARPLHTAALRGADLLLLEDGHCLREHALDERRQRGAQQVEPPRRRVHMQMRTSARVSM